MTQTSDLDPVALLEQMLRIPSLSGQEVELARFLADEMSRLGFEGYVDGAGNAVGAVGEGPAIVLLGHIDTVPGAVPVRVVDGKLYGRGAVDAKGPFAAFVAAAARLVARGQLEARLVLVGAVEEEAASSKGAHYIADRYTPAACVIGEPSGWDRLTLGYKGRLLIEGRWQQPMAHSAGREIAVAERAVAFWNAVQRYCAARNDGRTLLFDQLIPSLRAINSGSDGLADWAELTIGVRLPPGLDPDALARDLEQHAEDKNPLHPDTTRSWVENERRTANDEAGAVRERSVRPSPFAVRQTQDQDIHRPILRFRGGCPAYRADKNTPLVRAFLKGVRAAGGAPGFLLKTGTSDMNVVGPAWRCPILAYGPGDSGLDHTPDEHVPIAEYLRAIDVLEVALREMARAISA